MAKLINGHIVLDTKLPLGWQIGYATYSAPGTFHGQRGVWVSFSGNSLLKAFAVLEDTQTQESWDRGIKINGAMVDEIKALSEEEGAKFSPSKYVADNRLGMPYMRQVAERGPTDTDKMEIGWMKGALDALRVYCQEQALHAA